MIADQEPSDNSVMSDWMTATIEERRLFVRTLNLPFLWVEKPVSLTTFVTSPVFLDHPYLSDIQYEFVWNMAEIFEASDDMDLTKVIIRGNQVQELVAVWGKGCLSCDQIVTDCVTGQALTVKDWTDCDKPCSVFSMDGKVRQVKWFKRGYGGMVRVTTTRRKTLKVFKRHKFFVAGKGWTSSWCAGDEIATVDGIEKIANIDWFGNDWYYDTHVPVARNYLAGGIWNHNSGKDTVVMIGIARILYLLGCLLNPQQVFGMPEYSSIDMLNIALNKEQAAENFFDPLKRMLARSPWFMEKLRVSIADRAIHCPPIIDRKFGDMYAVNVWSGSSGHESMDGKNLLVAVADEIDAFRHIPQSAGNRATKQASSAEAMYGMLSSSVTTRFPVVGKTVMISWPRYARSFIMSKLKDGKKEDAVFSSGPYATWDVKPGVKKSDFDRHFRKNPEDAMARYAAQPQETLERYFSIQGAVLTTFNTTIRELEFGYEYIRDEENLGVDPPVDENGKVDIRLVGRKIPRVKYCWHGDLAKRHDRASVAMAHHCGFVEDPEDANSLLPVVSLDLVAWWEAPVGGEIDLSEIRRFVLDFTRRGYTVGSVTFDGYASDEMIQILKRHDARGIRLRFGRDGKPLKEPMNAGYFSCDVNTKAYDTLKGLVYEERLEAFHCALLVQELLSLELIKGGRKVDHPSCGSKDISDAVAGAVYNALLHLNDAAWMNKFKRTSKGSIVGASAKERDAETNILVSEAIKARKKSAKGFGKPR